MAQGGGGMDFLMGNIPGTPIPIWLTVVAGGIGAAFLVPKFFKGNAAATTDQTASNAGTGQAGASGAIDPQTGLPYAWEVAGMGAGGGVPGGGPVTSQGTDLSSVNAALQEIIAILQGQQNPSGAGGVPAPAPNPPVQGGTGGTTGIGGTTPIGTASPITVPVPSGPASPGGALVGSRTVGTGVGGAPIGPGAEQNAPAPTGPQVQPPLPGQFGPKGGAGGAGGGVPVPPAGPFPGGGGGGTPVPPAGPFPGAVGTAGGGVLTRWERLNGLGRERRRG